MLSRPEASPARNWPPGLLWSLALGVALRLLLLGRFAPWDPQMRSAVLLVGDALEYHELAQCLMGGSFCDSTIRTPGYPLFLAFTYALLGPVPWLVLVLQIVMDAVTAVLTYRLGRRLFSPAVGLAAAALVAIDPTLILASASLLTDSLFTMLITAALYTFVVTKDQGRSLVGIAAVGFLLALATIVRPVGQYVPFILLPFVLLAVGMSWRQRSLQAAVLLLAFVSTLSPWLYRNYHTYHRVALSTVQDEALLFWDVTYYLHGKTGRSVEDVRKGLREELQRVAPPESQDRFGWADKAGEVALRYMRADPVGYAQAHVRGILFMYSNLGLKRAAEKLRLTPPMAPNGAEGVAESAPRQGSVWLLAAGVALVQFSGYAWALVGLACLLWRRDRLRELALLLAVIGYFSAVVGPVGQPRYRLPAMPAYVLLAGVGLACAVAWRRRIRFAPLPDHPPGG